MRSGTIWSHVKFMALAGLPLMLAGCGASKKTAEMPNPALQDEARVVDSPPVDPVRATPRDTAPPPEASAGGSSFTARLQGPRTQQQIENNYRMPEIAPPRASAPVQPYVPPADGAVTGEASWNVPITREWNHIVIHHSASTTGSAAIFDKAHRERGWDGLGYHFVIGNGSASGDGEVEVGYRWTRQMQGAHAGNMEYNQHGIGICLVGDFEHGRQPSPAQMYSLRRLVRFLQVKTGVPTSEVCGHRNVPGKQTECPGEMDLNAFRASLGPGAIGVPIQIVNSTTSNTGSRPHLVRSTGGANIP